MNKKDADEARANCCECPLRSRSVTSASCLSLFCLAALTIAASAAASPPVQPPRQPSEMHAVGSTARLLQNIKDEIGDAACDADAQCHTIGIGAKSCGGPESFLGWSSKATDRDRLTALVAKHRDARRSENERSEGVSDCRVIPAPTAACRPRASDGERVCQLGQGARGRVD
jgi:hypothetical protein